MTRTRSTAAKIDPVWSLGGERRSPVPSDYCAHGRLVCDACAGWPQVAPSGPWGASSELHLEDRDLDELQGISDDWALSADELEAVNNERDVRRS